MALPDTHDNHKFPIVAAVQKLISIGIVYPEQFMGYSGADVAKLRGLWNGTFPRSYEEFLLILGRGAGTFLRGTHMLLPPEELIQLRSVAQELLSLTGLRLPDDAFVFGVHQGYQAFFFQTEPAVADPPVFIYTEGGQPPIRPRWASFSEFVNDEVDRHIALEKAIERLRKGGPTAPDTSF